MKGESHAPRHPSALKRLITSVVLYMILALLGGIVAIVENLPAQISGSSGDLTVPQSFVYGIGTALSPPLYTLIIQLVFLWLAPRREGWGTVGVLGLALIGLMTGIGALGEPINQRIFNPATFDPLKAILMAGMILVFGVMEWSRRRQEK